MFRSWIYKPLVRAAVSSFQAIRRSIWTLSRPQVDGVHAIALTPAGNIVLVRLTYASGWRLPGGGLKRGEEGSSAVLRELREEIGMLDHGSVTLLRRFTHEPDHKVSDDSLFLVRDVTYRAPKWSLEIDEVTEFARDDLPSAMPEITRSLLSALPE